MRYFTFITIFILCSVQYCSGTSRAFNSEIGKLNARIVEDLLEEKTDDNLIEKYVEGLSDDGEYSDINYSDGTFNMAEHLNRLLAVALAYNQERSAFYQNEGLVEKIEKGLSYWHERNPQFSNWWWTKIGVPQRIGRIILLSTYKGRDLSEELLEKILDRWSSCGGHPSEYGGANQTDVALHWIYRGCIAGDEGVLKEGLYWMFYPIQYSLTEGFQTDGSFFQGGPQLYIGGYSEVLLTSILSIATYTQGTKYELDREKVDIISKYMREILANTIRGHVMNFDCHGRSISRKDQLDKSSLVKIYQQLANIDATNKDEITEIANRLKGVRFSPKSFHAYLYNGDYTIHVRPNYSFSVRTVSERTLRNEYGNDENLLGYFVSDGATCITQTGDEYYNIMPLWDWTKVPGTTAPSLSSIPLPAKAWFTYGTSELVGGVSDSIYGATMYSYYDDWKNVNTGGNKGYFFFDDEVVCLGNGLKSDHDFYTSVNQCLGKDNYVIKRKGEVEEMIDMREDPISSSDVLSVYHDKIGYFFPNGGDLLISNTEKEGNWYDINKRIEKDSVVKGRVFTLAIKHLSVPQEQNYQYIITPQESFDSFSDYCERNPIQILSNNNLVQAVHHKEKKITQALFYNKGKLEGDIEISASHPCCILIKELLLQSMLVVHVSEPTQKLENIEISIRLPGMEEKLIWEVDLKDETEENKGMSKTIRIPIGKSTKANDVIRLSTRQCRIYNLQGVLVKNIDLLEDTFWKDYGLKKGVYIVETQTTKGKKYKKMRIK